MMLSLGMFSFSLDTLPYQDLSRRTDFRHAQTARVGARAANQYLGLGNDTMTLSGYIMPEVAGDPDSLDTVREMGASGEAWPLVDGSGRVHGAFVIDGVDQRASAFFADGTPRRIEFTIDLRCVDA